jgi:hypothetical protein
VYKGNAGLVDENDAMQQSNHYWAKPTPEVLNFLQE